MRNLHHRSYVVLVKSTVEILQNFMAFSEYMNFTLSTMQKASKNWVDLCRYKELNGSSSHDLDHIWRKVIWLGGENLFQIVCFRGVGICISLLLFIYSMFYGLHSISNYKIKALF